jgi:hypothetical protein
VRGGFPAGLRTRIKIRTHTSILLAWAHRLKKNIAVALNCLFMRIGGTRGPYAAPRQHFIRMHKHFSDPLLVFQPTPAAGDHLLL